MQTNSRIFVAGHTGLVGSAIARRLRQQGFHCLIERNRAEVDLRDRHAVDRLFEETRPEYVFMAAAKVGGILANDSYPAEFLYDNLAIALNVIDASYRHGVKKFAFLGSSCVYPKYAPQPMKEECLLTSALEPTNEAYAIAKIAGIKMIEAYGKQYGFRGITLMPANLYGPGDHFDLASSHVIPALMRKFHDGQAQKEAEVVVWGSGMPRREFLHVDDLAHAAVFLMLHYDEAEIVNVGTGEDLTIRELAELLQRVTSFQGKLSFDTTKPDGTPRKVMDVSKLRALGWRHSISLEDGIRATYEWYRSSVAR